VGELVAVSMCGGYLTWSSARSAGAGMVVSPLAQR
jgi:hypothetical protein